MGRNEILTSSYAIVSERLAQEAIQSAQFTHGRLSIPILPEDRFHLLTQRVGKLRVGSEVIESMREALYGATNELLNNKWPRGVLTFADVEMAAKLKKRIMRTIFLTSSLPVFISSSMSHCSRSSYRYEAASEANTTSEYIGLTGLSAQSPPERSMSRTRVCSSSWRYSSHESIRRLILVTYLATRL